MAACSVSGFGAEVSDSTAFWLWTWETEDKAEVYKNFSIAGVQTHTGFKMSIHSSYNHTESF